MPATIPSLILPQPWLDSLGGARSTVDNWRALGQASRSNQGSACQHLGLALPVQAQISALFPRERLPELSRFSQVRSLHSG